MASIRPARAYLSPQAPIRLIAQHGKAGLKRDLRAALPHLRGLFDRQRGVFLLRNGRLRELPDSIDWKHFREILKTVFDRWARTYEAGAALGARKINGSFHARQQRVRFRKHNAPHNAPWGAEEWRYAVALVKAIGDRFAFDRFDEAAQTRLRDAQDTLIRELEGTARDTINTVVNQGMRQGLDAGAIVDDIWTVIDLTDRQALAVMNYERMLRDLDPDALRRQLRDTDFDNAMNRAIQNDEPLDDAVIGEMVDAYEANYLDYRADTIAQTESNRAANWGLHDAYSQAVERGAIPEEAVTRHWQLGDHPCPICENIYDTNEPDGVGVNEPFDSDDGPQDEPPIHPNCQCAVEYVTDLSLVPDEDTEAETPEEETPTETTEAETPEVITPKTPERNIPDIQITEEGGGLSRPTEERFRGFVDELPDDVLSSVADHGGSFVFSRNLTDTFPELKGVTPRGWQAGKTWDNAEGLYHSGTKQIALSEFVKDESGVFVRNDRERGVLFHETGHAYDDALGRASRTTEFRDAYQRDTAKLTDAERRNFGYYIQAGDAGPSEAFAEVFANVLGEGAGSKWSGTKILDVFPEVTKYMRELLA